jgi:hypothetical protein
VLFPNGSFENLISTKLKPQRGTKRIDLLSACSSTMPLEHPRNVRALGLSTFHLSTSHIFCAGTEFETMFLVTYNQSKAPIAFNRVAMQKPLA